MARIDYIVEIAVQGASQVTGNIEFTLGIEDLADIPVITGPTLNIVRATSVMRPFTVLALDTDGLLTDLFTNGGRWAAIGRLARVRQSIDGGSFSIIGNGRISSIDESDGPGRYRIEVADESWVARNSEIFTLANTTQLWPQGIVADWRGFRAAEVGTAIVSDWTKFDYSDGVSRRAWIRHGGRGRLITESLIRWLEERLVDSPEPPGFANSSADNFPGVRLNYGGVDYPIISFTSLSGTNVPGIDFLQTLKLSIDPEDDAVNFLIFFRSLSTPPPPPQPAFIHIVSDEPPSKDLPLHIGIANASHPWGTANGWIHPATLTRRVWDEIGVRYENASLTALEADTSLPPLAFDVTEVVKDPERWLLDNVWVPLLLAPSFNHLGERTLVDMRLPQDLDPDTLPLLDASNTNTNTWQLAGRDTVNSITWTYAHYFEAPQDQVKREKGEGPPPEGRTDIRMDGLIYSEREAPQRPAVDTDDVSINSVGRINLALRLPGALKRSESSLGLPIFIDRGPAMFDGVTAQVSREVLDIFKDGAYRLRGEVSRTASASIVEGDLVLLDLSSVGLPNPASGARSDLRLVRVMGITRYPAYAEVEFLDLGPNAQPLAAPTLEVDFFASPRRVTVDITDIPAGATATLELAYTSSSAEPTRWPIRRTNLASGTYTFRDVPAAGFAHVRVRSVAPNRIRSVWVHDFAPLTLIPAILDASVAIDSAGVPIVALDASSAVAGIRLRLAIHSREQEPVFGPNNDHAVGEFPLVLSGVVVPSSSAFTVEIEPWTGFSAGSVTGTAGSVFTVSTERGVVGLALLLRATVQSIDPSEAVVRVAVADPRPTSNITITYEQAGVGGVAPSSPQTIPSSNVTSDLNTTGFVDFTIDLTGTAGIVTFTASAPNRQPDTGSVQFAEPGPPGPDGTTGPSIARIWNLGGTVNTDVLIRLEHSEGDGGILQVWVNPTGIESPDPSGPADGSVAVPSTPFTATASTVFGGAGTLLNNVPVAATQLKTIFARFTDTEGRVATGQKDLEGIIEVVDPFGVLVSNDPGGIVERLALKLVTNPNLAERAVAFRNLVVGSYDNLCLDPSFERNPTLSESPWTPISLNNGGTWSIGTTTPRTGQRAALYNTAGQTGEAHLTSTDVGLSSLSAEPGHEFYFEFWARATSAANNRTARAGIIFRNATDGIVLHSLPTATSLTAAYQKFSHSAVAPAGATQVQFDIAVPDVGSASIIRVDDCFARLKVDGTLVVDGSILTKHISAGSITTPLLAAKAATFEKVSIGSLGNMVPDPIFSSGDLAESDWTVTVAGGGTWDITTANPRVGAFCLRYARAGQVGEARIRHAATGMEATENDEFFFRAFVRGTGAGSGTSAGVRITFRNDAGGIVASFSTIGPAAVGSYVSRARSAVAPAGTTRVDFECVVSDNGTTQAIHFDDAYAQRKVDSNLYVDGSIFAQHLSVATLDAISANVGVLTAGQLRNVANSAGILLSGSVPGSWNNYIDLVTGGSAPFIQSPNFQVLANGNAFFSGTLSAADGTFAGDLLAAGGTFAGNLSAAGGTFSGTVSAGAVISSGSFTASNITLTQISTTTIASNGNLIIDANGTFDLQGTVMIRGATVFYGIPDSAGSGFRTLRIVNADAW